MSKRNKTKRLKRRSKNRHHIINKCRGGSKHESNLLVLDVEKHNAWHRIFKNMSFLDVIYLLLRTLKAKKHCDYEEAKEVVDDYISNP